MLHASYHHVRLPFAHTSATPASILYSHIAHPVPSLTNSEVEHWILMCLEGRRRLVHRQDFFSFQCRSVCFVYQAHALHLYHHSETKSYENLAPRSVNIQENLRDLLIVFAGKRRDEAL
jgi:hypothetical protein